MGKKKGYLISVLVIIAFLVIAGISIKNVVEKKLESFKTMNFSGLDMNTVYDGIYTGNADGTIVKVALEVTVKDHAITSIRILKHDNGKGKPAEAIVDDIIARNSLDVDAVSGATYSSSIIKAAVFDALTK